MKDNSPCRLSLKPEENKHLAFLFTRCWQPGGCVWVETNSQPLIPQEFTERPRPGRCSPGHRRCGSVRHGQNPRPRQRGEVPGSKKLRDRGWWQMSIHTGPQAPDRVSQSASRLAVSDAPFQKLLWNVDTYHFKASKGVQGQACDMHLLQGQIRCWVQPQIPYLNKTFTLSHLEPKHQTPSGHLLLGSMCRSRGCPGPCWHLGLPQVKGGF